MATAACSPTSFPSWHSTTESWDEDFDFEDKGDERENSPALLSSRHAAATDGFDFQDQEGDEVRVQTLLVVPLELQQKEKVVWTDLSYIKDFVKHVQDLKTLVAIMRELSLHHPCSLHMQSFLSRTQPDWDCAEAMIDIGTSSSHVMSERRRDILREILAIGAGEECVGVGREQMLELVAYVKELADRLRTELEGLKGDDIHLQFSKSSFLSKTKTFHLCASYVV
ncbi:hypothetical protein BC937DRAFT_88857 [Endogone sp. FLAS-F59071]|nr:hypothetical protein BC937DRAFT_90003 [Endogone sp. FLAS-F59071]RUS18351.1 hypothetical protein BC937DRAFT_88857 [Endogone sp. FLAS-F59071]|eukprot:RUS17414.1 hypothetical protein BC937DRAFT_90003 [Endogone sp. FLAS-F59071]